MTRVGGYEDLSAERCVLRVRVTATALGLPDLLMCRGSYALTPRLPFTPGQELSGVVTSRDRDYRVRTENLSTYLTPKSPIDVTKAMLHERGGDIWLVNLRGPGGFGSRAK